jgi:hypothetical protein
MKTLILSVSTFLLAYASTAKSYALAATPKAYYNSAKAEIQEMLDGTTPASYERAIFLIENAWNNNSLNYKQFEATLDFQTAVITEIAVSAIDSNKMNPNRDLLESAQQKKHLYIQAISNYAIYAYMTKPSIIKGHKGAMVHIPFKYSTSDPMGTTDWKNTQVTHLMENGQGNCFAFASLYKIFADRFESGARLCTAPGHIYIRHADDKGIQYNVETANRSFPGTGTLVTLTYTTDEAAKNNISLRELDTRQSLALCLVYLAKGYENRWSEGNETFVLECADLALKYDSLNLNARLLKAEVLEKRLMAKNMTIEQLRTNADFRSYESLVIQTFDLGYREMPFKMKNILIQGWTKDSTIELTGIDHTPTKFKLGEEKERRASLSWGFFDEAIGTKSIERYGNTAFDSKKRRIIGFLRPDQLYNNYTFDPVVFAFSIDPMAHKYSHASPYNFVENNPIRRVDADGREWVNGYDAAIIELQAKAKANPTDKSIESRLAYATSMRNEVARVMDQVRANDPALYNYIDQLTYTRTNGDGVTTTNNLKVVVNLDMGGEGSQKEAGSTDRLPIDTYKGQYGGKEVVLPLNKGFVGFNVTLYGGIGRSKDATLANEAGDVMYFMEFNDKAVAEGSNKPLEESYRSKGSGKYSDRVEDEYRDRRSQTQNGTPPTSNPYPLPEKKP